MSAEAWSSATAAVVKSEGGESAKNDGGHSPSSVLLAHSCQTSLQDGRNAPLAGWGLHALRRTRQARPLLINCLGIAAP